MKGLDQPARATLRKYGVRFGAYHIYLPLLLKPAPRALAAQLWALRHDGPEPRASTSCCISPAAGAPRSRSIARSTPVLYRTAGYRVCGERAVRVDILERLADLIRPALAWREGVPRRNRRRHRRRRFHGHSTMTSLTGASGEGAINTELIPDETDDEHQQETQTQLEDSTESTVPKTQVLTIRCPSSPHEHDVYPDTTAFRPFLMMLSKVAIPS